MTLHIRGIERYKVRITAFLLGTLLPSIRKNTKIKVMRDLKHRRTVSSRQIFQFSKDICPRCTKSTNAKERRRKGLLNYYEKLCRSSKCLIHNRKLSPKMKQTEMELEKKDMTSEILNLTQLNIPYKTCTIDEFEEESNYPEDIDLEMYAKIESTVEDFDQKLDKHFGNTFGYGFLKEVINEIRSSFLLEELEIYRQFLIQRTIIWPLKKPEIFKGLRTVPKGILLFGPPGTGKTLLGKYIATETNSTFFNISASTLMSKWMGESEKLVRTMFLVAKARQPSVIFINEIDGILSKRTPEENGSTRRMKNEFLVCMDGNDASDRDRIIIIGATNRPHELDEAARHRFLKRFYISLPDELDRKEILLKLLECECHSLDDIDIYDIVRKTEGYSVADLKNLSQEAAMGSIKALAGSAIVHLRPNKIRPISMTDFLCALELIKPTVSQEQVKLCEEWDSLYGYGGAGNLKN